jgi:hypothetical protein
MEELESRTRYNTPTTLAQQGFSRTTENPDTNPDMGDTKKLYLMRSDNYTIPRIYRGQKEWFVEYFFRNPYSDQEKWDRFRIRGKMNYEHDLLKREKLAQQLQAGLHKALKAGKTPTRYQRLKVSSCLLYDKLNDLARSEGLGKSLDTKNAYLLMIGRLRKYFDFIGITDPQLEDFTQDRAQEFKEFLMEEMELKNVTVNTTIQPLKMFFKILVSKSTYLNTEVLHSSLSMRMRKKGYLNTCAKKIICYTCSAISFIPASCGQRRSVR